MTTTIALPRSGRIALLLALLVSLFVGGLAAISAQPAQAANPESVSVGMPFTGRWARSVAGSPNDCSNYGTHPSCHPLHASGSNWSEDLFANNTDVKANFANPTGTLTLTASVFNVNNCSAGKVVRITAKVDGTEVGWVQYVHLDTTLSNGPISNGTVLGKTKQWTYDADCWQVSTASGVHAHIEVGNKSTTEMACYVGLTSGNSYAEGTVIGKIGTPTGATSNQQACSSGGGGTYNDRTILHGSDQSLWVMAGGAKFQFSTMQEFTNLGYTTAGMTEVSTATLATISTTPQSGTVLRGGGGQLYVVAGGAKFYFGSYQEYLNQGYTTNSWINVPQVPLDAIGDAPGNMPRDGTVIQAGGNLYVVAGGVKFQFGSMPEYYGLNYTDGQISYVSTGPTNSIPTVSTSNPPRNRTILVGGGGQLYVVAGGAKFYFGTWDEYVAAGYASSPRTAVPQSLLDGIGDAPSNLPSNGTVLQSPAGSTIYLMQAGQRKAFTSWSQFTGMGYTSADIIMVPDGPLMSLPNGGNLT